MLVNPQLIPTGKGWPIETRAKAITLNVPRVISSIQTGGYANIGDGGAGEYIRVAVEPTHPGKFQSHDGAWWELVSTQIFANMFGAIGDGTNCTPAVQNAVLFVALAGGGTVSFAASDGHYQFDAKVLIPSDITIDGCGQEFKGGPMAVPGTYMFETGYLDAGAIITNIGTPPQSHLVLNSIIKNMRITEAGTVFNFFNFIRGCAILNVYTDNCQLGIFSDCFYMIMDNCSNTGSNIPGLFACQFTSANNAIQLSRVTITKENAFLLTGGGAEFQMLACTTEGGGGSAVKVEGDQTISILDHYAEAWPGTVFDFSDSGLCSVEIHNCWFNGVDIAFQDGPVTLIGNWSCTNRIVNIGAAPNRGLMNVAGIRNFINFEYGGDQNDITFTAPNWNVSKNTNFHTLLNFNADGAVDIRAKTNYWKNSIIPLNYQGDVGDPFPGQVEFSAITYPTGPAVTLNVLSSITYQEFANRATFYFVVTTGAGTLKIFGEVYGDQVKQHDISGKVVTVSNNGGKLQLNILALDNGLGIGACRGILRIAS